MGEAGQRRRLEQAAQWHVDPEGAAQPRYQPGGEQRVTSQIEEVVVAARPVDAQQLAPHRGQAFLDRRPRRLPGGVRSGEARAGRRPAPQLRPIDLAVGGERKRLDHREGRRHHICRQPAGEIHPQLGECRRRPRDPQKGDQAPVPRPRLDRRRHHHRPGHPRMLLQSRFHLRRLDPEAAHLELAVGAAEEIHPAVRQMAGQVARTVEAPARRRIGVAHERIGPEALGGQRRPVVVTAGQTGAADPQLPWHPRRHRLEPAVEQVDPAVGERPADRHRTLVAGQLDGARGLETGAVDRRLAQTVGADHPRLGAAKPPQARQLAPLPDVGADRQEAHEVEAPFAVIVFEVLHQAAHHGRHELGGVDPSVHHPFVEPRRLEQQHLRAQHQTAAGAQRPHQVADEDVEGKAGHLEVPAEAAQPIVLLPGPVDARQRAMAHRHPLGPAGGAGGVDDVGGVLRQYREPRRSLRDTGRDGTRVDQHCRQLPRAAVPAPGANRRRLLPHRQQQASARVAQHEAETLAAVIGIQWHEGGARQVHAQHGDDALHRGIDRDRYPGLRPGPPPA